jgi:hypothetical protein
MGGGFRSVPPASQPFADLGPGKTRKLATRLVSLTAPTEGAQVNLPAKGEPLRLADISALTNNAEVQVAVKRLSGRRVPDTVAQLAIWRIVLNLDWPTIARLSQQWANKSELALARSFVAHLESMASASDDAGRLYVEIESAGRATENLAADLRAVLKSSMMLGLPVELGVPANAEGPAIACRVRLSGPAEGEQATVLVSATDSSGKAWHDSGRITVSVPKAATKPELRAADLADRIAGSLLDRLVRVTLIQKPPHAAGTRETLQIRIDNASPLVLNGLTIVGTSEQAPTPRATLIGIAVSPRKPLVVPTSRAAIERLHLSGGIHAYAANLSGL